MRFLLKYIFSLSDICMQKGMDSLLTFSSSLRFPSPPSISPRRSPPSSHPRPKFLAMPLAFLCVQAVRSIAWRSDQTAKNCSLTLPRLLPSPSLLQYCRIYLSAAEVALHVLCAWSLAWCMCVCVCVRVVALQVSSLTLMVRLFLALPKVHPSEFLDL